ncbi:MAG: FG-GAP-like repeat-containing protein [Candidatus Cloacimonadaceae bacterium]
MSFRLHQLLWIVVSISFCVILSPVLCQEHFTEVTAELQGVYYGALDWGDCDNDGDLDLLLTGYYWSLEYYIISKLYNNDGAGNFTDTNADLVGIHNASVAWGDYNNNGNLDILAAGSYTYPTFTGITSVYTNDFTPDYSPVNLNILGVWGGSVQWGDYDNDGDMDLLVTGRKTSNPNLFITAIYKNDGKGNLREFDPGLINLQQSQALWGDYDNDCDLDILLIGTTTNYHGTSRIYRNDSNNVFTDIGADIANVFKGSIDWGDYDNDGDLDILLSGRLHYGVDEFVTAIYRNDGSDIFTDIQAGLPGVENGVVVWGDYDNDGDLDILLNGVGIWPNIYFSIYSNIGNDNFVSVEHRIPGIYESSSQWGDYDNDGDLDIALTGKTSNHSCNARLFRNNCAVANTPPSPPANLRAEVSYPEVLLSWDMSYDQQTPSEGLTYNLRAGTSPGAFDVCNPISDLESGKRKIVGMGNTGPGLFHRLNYLAPGVYYWSVQAIDTAFAGSMFAEEQSFIVPVPEEMPARSDRLSLTCYPNPFRTVTAISLDPKAAANTSLEIYNIKGQLVKKFSAKQVSSGSLNWDGRDEHGSQIAPGIYLIKAAQNSSKLLHKLVYCR